MFGKLLQLEATFSLKMHKKRLASRGGYIASPDPLAGFKVASSRHEMIRKGGREGTRGKRDQPHHQFLDLPL